MIAGAVRTMAVVLVHASVGIIVLVIVGRIKRIRITNADVHHSDRDQ